MSAQPPLPLTRALRQRREEFVVYPANAEAVYAIDAWPEWPGCALALIGPAGSGKSHLARAWAQRSGAATLASAALTVGAAPLDCSVLLDDADQAEAGEALFHLINEAARPGCGLLLTARTPPRDWPTAVPDLRSRLNAIRVVELGLPDEAGFGELLDSAFKSRGLKPSPDLLAYLARRIERSPAGAADVADRLDAYALTTGRPISRSVARELLGDQADLFRED